MKLVACLFVLVAVASAFRTEEQYRSLFEAWKGVHDREYVSEEEVARFGIFKERVDFIERHNADPTKTYTVSLNQFSDMTRAEWATQYLTLKLDNPSIVEPTPEKAVGGDGIDWRTKGAVNKIKDQGQCGSCWAFSAVSTAESAWEIAGNKLESLSESQVVDCDNQNAGCNGGDPSSALDYIIKTGIESEKDYPYKDYDRSCAFNKNKVTDVRIKDYIKVSSGSEDDLGTKLEQCGPVSVCIDADHDGFMSYSHGIYKEDNCGTSMYDLDHAIVAVGYTDEAWIVRNSWGTSWGEQGYVNMARNYGKGNMCGIATEAVCAVA